MSDLQWCTSCGEGVHGFCRSAAKRLENEVDCPMGLNSIVVERRPDTEGYHAGFDHDVSVFLAGSIEQGVAEMWQDRIIGELRKSGTKKKVLALNPRRTAWDASWVQSKENPHFFDQVSWELGNIHNANIVFFWFDPATKSPVSLLELGLILNAPDEGNQKIVIYCPDDFWRAGNVDITADFFGISVYKTPEEAIQTLISEIG